MGEENIGFKQGRNFAHHLLENIIKLTHGKSKKNSRNSKLLNELLSAGLGALSRPGDLPGRVRPKRGPVKPSWTDQAAQADCLADLRDR
ncbi:unnamed protein product [Lupinus luteus]|uniref:Uncharacterized protein n=1 Tax=Lupinus luteus TaxID=3873 RepID=A0AAV1XWT0_LUPLU